MVVRTLAVFGHSHLTGFENSFNALKQSRSIIFDIRTFQFLRKDTPHIVHIDNNWQYNPELINEAQKFLIESKAESVLFMLQGEQAILSGLYFPSPAYQFYTPDGLKVFTQIGADYVPFDAVAETLANDYALMDAFLDDFASKIEGRSFALCPPPPVSDPEFVLGHLSKFPEYDVFKEAGLPSSLWRVGIWQTSVTALRTVYEKHGVDFIDVNPKMLDANRCLARVYASDALHATTDYYFGVIEQLESLMSR